VQTPFACMEINRTQRFLLPVFKKRFNPSV
jgi:hypothetical protein